MMKKVKFVCTKGSALLVWLVASGIALVEKGSGSSRRKTLEVPNNRIIQEDGQEFTIKKEPSL
ncbi:hypothetical protein [Enterococcus sp. N249-2]